MRSAAERPMSAAEQFKAAVTSEAFQIRDGAAVLSGAEQGGAWAANLTELPSYVLAIYNQSGEVGRAAGGMRGLPMGCRQLDKDLGAPSGDGE